MSGEHPFAATSLVPLALIAVGLGALAMALIAQYLFGLAPCVLCLYQRVPFAIVAALGGLALLVPRRLRLYVVVLCGAVFLAGAALAFVHVGVEQGWWSTGIPGCEAPSDGGALPADLSNADFERMLSKPTQPLCTDVQWRLLGLSLAGWNVVASLGCAAACGLALRVMTRGGLR